jgi:hypothetical protein
VIHFFPEPHDEYERALFARVAEEKDARSFEELPPDALRQIAAREGCDYATALLHRLIVESARHGPFLRELARHPGANAIEPPCIAIVPGAFYQENPRTGADGKLVREVAQSLGLPTVVAPVASTGRVRENGRVLHEWLATRQHNSPLIVVSVSKGGSDLKAALAEPDAAAAFAHVVGWINLCGILDGTPMADWLLSPNFFARANRFVYRIRGRSLDFLADLRHHHTLDFPLELPVHLRTIHVLGFPLRHHLRNGLARRCHDRLKSFGPNDGSIVLGDALPWPGQLCPVWGADHYLRPRVDVRPLLAALLQTLGASPRTPVKR